MKTIKIIDLLNMISKGEEVPKKIRFDNTYWNRICGEKYPYYTNDYDSDLFIYFFRKNLTFSLNDEVEIIEPQEHKIPEKLEICYSPDIEEEIFYEKGNKPNHYVLGDAGNKLIISKINEILDYLEEKE